MKPEGKFPTVKTKGWRTMGTFVNIRVSPIGALLTPGLHFLIPFPLGTSFLPVFHPKRCPALTDNILSLQKPGWCLNISHRPHRSCRSTAGMATPDSSTSGCPQTLCCCAGCCMFPGTVTPHALMQKSLCKYETPAQSTSAWPRPLPNCSSFSTFPPSGISAMALLLSSIHWAPAFLMTPWCSLPSMSGHC